MTFSAQIPADEVCIAGSFRPGQVLRDRGGLREVEILQPLPIHR